MINKCVVFAFVLGFYTFILAQITTKSIATPDTILSRKISTDDANFLGKNVNGYIGQDLYLKCNSKKSDYEGFFTNYNDEELYQSLVEKMVRGKKTHMNPNDLYGNRYYSTSHGRSSYDKLVARYFTVLDVVPHPKANEDSYLYGETYYLKLKAKDNNDIVYFEYDTRFEFKFTFIAVNFFNKEKERRVGQYFVTRGRNWIDNKPSPTDINTGKSVDFQPGLIWKCITLTIEEKYCSLVLILENEKKEQIPLGVSRLKNEYYVITKTDQDVYIKKYGKELWQTIVAGKVQPGMTVDMCRLSWGKPKDINNSFVSGIQHEQWVYGSGNYLYFENGKLKSIQN